MIRDPRDPIYQVTEFLIESSAIEKEYSSEALLGSLRAWEAAITRRKLNLEDILDIHFYLMETLRPDIAGALRKVDVMVGGRLCPSPYLVEPMLKNWFLDHAKAKTESGIQQAHVAFEKIHPFEDGNGRTGRIIMNWQRIKAGKPLEIIHVGAEQKDYYSWFN